MEPVFLTEALRGSEHVLVIQHILFRVRDELEKRSFKENQPHKPKSLSLGKD